MPHLLSELSSPPPFLAPEKAAVLQALKATIQAGVDGDEVHQVVVHFQRITDPQKRRDTIAQLQQLV